MTNKKDQSKRDESAEAKATVPRAEWNEAGARARAIEIANEATSWAVIAGVDTKASASLAYTVLWILSGQRGAPLNGMKGLADALALVASEHLSAPVAPEHRSEFMIQAAGMLRTAANAAELSGAWLSRMPVEASK